MSINIDITVKSQEALNKLKDIENNIKALGNVSPKDFTSNQISAYIKNIGEAKKELKSLAQTASSELSGAGRKVKFDISEPLSQLDNLSKSFKSKLPQKKIAIAPSIDLTGFDAAVKTAFQTTFGREGKFTFPVKLQGLEESSKHLGSVSKEFRNLHDSIDNTNKKFNTAKKLSDEFARGVIDTIKTSRIRMKQDDAEQRLIWKSESKDRIENLKNLRKAEEYLLNPSTRKISIVSPVKDAASQIRDAGTSMTGLSLRLTNIQKGMTEAFAAGNIEPVLAKLAVVKRDMNVLRQDMSKPLVGTDHLTGRMDLLQRKFMDTSKSLNKMLNPSRLKNPLSMDDVSSSLRNLQIKLSETANSFVLFKKGKGSLADLQASFYKTNEELIKFQRQVRKGGFTDAFATDITNTKNSISGLMSELKQFNMPTKIKIGRGILNIDEASSFSIKLQEIKKHLFDMGTGLIYIGRTGLTYFSAPMIALGAFALKSFSNLQQANLAFKALTGSAEVGGAAFKDLVNFAQNNPVDMTSLMHGTRQLIALGFSAKDAVPMMKVLAESVAAVGASPETLDRVALAFSQIKAKAKLSAEEIRQIGNTGLPIIEILTKKMKLEDPSKFYETIKKRIVSGDDAVKAAIEGLNEKFHGFFELQKKTLGGSWQLLVTNGQVALAKLGEILNTSFTVPETLLRLSNILKLIGDSISNFPSLVKVSSEFVGLATALLIAASALGVFAKMWSYLSGYRKLVDMTFGASALIKVLGWVGIVYLIAENWSLVARSILKVKIAFMELTDSKLEGFGTIQPPSWLQKFIGKPPTVESKNTALALYKKELHDLNVEQEKQNNFASIFGKAGEEYKKDLEGMAKKSEQLIKVWEQKADFGKQIKTAIEDANGAIKAHIILSGIMGDKYNAAKENVQTLENLILHLSEIFAKSGDTDALKGVNVALEKIKEWKIPADMLEISINIAKITEELKNANASVDLLGKVGGSSFNIFKEKLNNVNQAIQQLSKLKDVPEVLNEMKKLASQLPELQFKSDVADVWIKFNEQITEADGLLGVTGDKFENLKIKIKAAEDAIKKLGDTQASTVAASDISKLLSQYNTEGIDLANQRIEELKNKLLSMKVPLVVIQTIMDDAAVSVEGLSGSFEERFAIYTALLREWGTMNKKIAKDLKTDSEIWKESVAQASEYIKGIWNHTALTFHDVWKKVLDNILDLLIQIVAESLKAKTAVSSVSSVSSDFVGPQKPGQNSIGGMSTNIGGNLINVGIGAGVGFIIASINESQQEFKRIKDELKRFPILMKDIFTTFISDFKSALSDFKEKLFPEKTATASTFEKIKLILNALGKGRELSQSGSSKYSVPSKGLELLNNLSPLLQLNTSIANIFGLRPGKVPGIAKTPETTILVNEFNTILKEFGIKVLSSTKIKKSWLDIFGSDKVYYSIAAIQNRIVELAKKLSENLVSMTTSIVDRFGKIKDIVHEILDLYKQQKDFSKEMSKTIEDVRRSTMSTGGIFTAKKSDISGLESQNTVNNTNINNLKEQLRLGQQNLTNLEAQSDQNDATKLSIALQKTDLIYLRQQYKDINNLQIDNIKNTKEAYVTFWDTVKTLIMETIDLIKQKTDFIKDIDVTIQNVKDSSKTALQLFQQSIDTKNRVETNLGGKTGQERISILGELKVAWMNVWDNAKTFFSDLTTKISDLMGQKSDFGKGIDETIKSVTNSTKTLEQLFESQKLDLKNLKTAYISSVGQNRVNLLNDLKTSYTTVWDSAQKMFDTSGTQSELKSSNDRLSQIAKDIAKETDIKKLADLAQERKDLEAQVVILNTDLASKQASLTDWQSKIVSGLKEVKTSGESNYDMLIATMKNMASGVADLNTWQGRVVSGLYDIQLEGTSAYDDLIQVNTDLLGIASDSKDLVQALNDKLIELQNTVIDKLDGLTGSGVDLFDNLIKSNLDLLGINSPLYNLESEMNGYLLNLDKNITTTLSTIQSLGNSIVEQIPAKLDLITQTLNSIFNIPQMASGGIVNRPTLALVGESGPEAIVPLNKMRGSGNVNVSIDGAMIMDEITMIKFARTLERKFQNQQSRYV